MRRAYTHLVQSKPNFDNAFTFTVQTDDVGTSANNQFTLPIDGVADPMQIDWGDDTFQTGVTSLVTHTYPIAGLYTIKINNCNRFGFSGGGDKIKMRQVSQLGGNFRITQSATFLGCEKMTWSANINDTPIIETATPFQTFQGCFLFNGQVNNWDMSGVTQVFNFFALAPSFNQPLNNWNVSNVTSMGNMFNGATSFNQPLNNWNVSNVQAMQSMFRNTAFNQDISNWNISSVNNLNSMFRDASFFNQNLQNWNLKSTLTDLRSIFSGTSLSCINYTDTLVSWINQAKTNNAPLNVDASGQLGRFFATSRSGGVNYADAGVARTNAIETIANGGLGWFLSQDTVQSNC